MHCTQLDREINSPDFWMVILTAGVIGNPEMDDIGIGAAQPCCCYFFEMLMEVVSVCRLVFPLLLLSSGSGWSLVIMGGGCGCLGSTTLARHAQCSLCSFYSCQPTDSLLPIMYSKQCFFFFHCLMFVLCPCGSCCCE